MDVLFDDLAVYELNDASEYYELEVPGLGIRFKNEEKNQKIRTKINNRKMTV